MLQQSVADIFERDLAKLKEEISSYANESDLWIVQEGISNPGGNLCLHLLGNLNHFIGAVLGHTGYVRNRPAEFDTKDVPREELLKAIDATMLQVKHTLQQLPDEALRQEFPQTLGGKTYTTAQFIIHLTTHLSYHLGQINYHRRLLSRP